MSDQAKCRSCGAAIRWGRTQSGKAMPLDAEPVPDGTLGIAPNGEIYSKGDEAGDRYKSHFATCPNAATHRKEKR